MCILNFGVNCPFKAGGTTHSLLNSVPAYIYLVK